MNISYDRYLSEYSRSEELTLAVLLMLIMLASLYGNVAMLIVLYKNDRMWTTMNILIGNVSLTGVCVTLTCMPFSLLSVIKSGWIFGEGSVCHFNAMVNSLFLLVTIFTHTLISVDKYFAVVRPFSRFLTVKKTWFLIGMAWFGSLLMTILPNLGFGRFEYNASTLICGVGFPRGHVDLYYLIMLASVGFAIPVLVLGHVYIKIFMAVQDHKKRLQTISKASLDVVALQRRLIRTVFCSMLCFLICWSPFCILTLMAVFVHDRKELPRGLGVAAYWCGYLNSSLFPVIICSMSIRFHEGLISTSKAVVLLPVRAFRSLKSCCSYCCSTSKQTSLQCSPPQISNRIEILAYQRVTNDDLSAGSPTTSLAVTPSTSISSLRMSIPRKKTLSKSESTC